MNEINKTVEQWPKIAIDAGENFLVVGETLYQKILASTEKRQLTAIFNGVKVYKSALFPMRLGNGKIIDGCIDVAGKKTFLLCEDENKN